MADRNSESRKIKRLVFASIAIAALASTNAAASGGPSCSTNLVDWSDYDATLSNLDGAFRSEEFEALDEALDCLANTDRRFVTGHAGPIGAYWFYRIAFPAPGVDIEQARAVDAWLQARPDSPYGQFASIRMIYATAWAARGGRRASKTEEERLEAYRLLLADAEIAITSDANPLAGNPVSQMLLQAIKLDTQGAGQEAVQVFEENIARWPNNFEFYETMLTRLVPSWGGSWETIDYAIRHWNETLADTEGDSTYARFYYFLHSNRYNYKETMVDWETMKPSLNDLVSRHPTHRYRNVAASYGCLFKDKEFFYKYAGVNPNRTSAGELGWLYSTDRGRCHDIFEVWH